MINVRADFITQQIQYIPSCKDIKHIFEEIIVLGVNHICGEHKMLLNSPEFNTYVNIGDNINEAEEHTVDIYRLITMHDTYVDYKNKALSELESIFQYIVDKSFDLKEALEIVIRATSFSRKDLENKERSECYAYLEGFLQDEEVVKRLNEKMDVGIFCFDRSELKSKIFNMPSECLELIEENIPGIIENRCQVFSDKMNFYIDLLSQPTMEVN